MKLGSLGMRVPHGIGIVCHRRERNIPQYLRYPLASLWFDMSLGDDRHDSMTGGSQALAGTEQELSTATARGAQNNLRIEFFMV
jgi:hypothetical protein